MNEIKEREKIKDESGREEKGGREKIDGMKIFNCDLSPDEDDLFSDCRSQHSGSQVNISNRVSPVKSMAPSFFGLFINIQRTIIRVT